MKDHKTRGYNENLVGMSSKNLRAICRSWLWYNKPLEDNSLLALPKIVCSIGSGTFCIPHVFAIICMVDPHQLLLHCQLLYRYLNFIHLFCLSHLCLWICECCSYVGPDSLCTPVSWLCITLGGSQGLPVS